MICFGEFFRRNNVSADSQCFWRWWAICQHSRSPAELLLSSSVGHSCHPRECVTHSRDSFVDLGAWNLEGGEKQLPSCAAQEKGSHTTSPYFTPTLEGRVIVDFYTFQFELLFSPFADLGISFPDTTKLGPFHLFCFFFSHFFDLPILVHFALVIQ